MKPLDAMLHWVREREAVRIKKETGKPFPWTEDEIIDTYRFCNVRREDDRVTVWVREHIREPFAGSPYLWLMMCIARQINWPDTLAELIAKKAWPVDETFRPSKMSKAMNARKDRGEKLYTGAYMISAPSTKGADKQVYIAEEVCGELWERREHFPTFNVTMRNVHAWISKTNGWGPFMAYQAVVDMRFTPLLAGAKDISSWAAAGPGTLRGLNRIHERDLDRKVSQEQAVTEMRTLYPIIQATGVTLDFSDVPNVLCETDKYLRVLNGEGKPRARYVPGRGA